MTMIIVVLVLFFLSFALSLRSLRIELKKNIHTKEVSEELFKGRTIFQAGSEHTSKAKHKDVMEEQAKNSVEDIRGELANMVDQEHEE